MNTGKVDVLLGLQWGDEGKGKVVDVLTPHYDVIARFQGGPNAGHTLEFEGATAADFKLSSIDVNSDFSSWTVFDSGVMGASNLASGDNALSTSYGTANMHFPVSGNVTLTISNVTETSCTLNITLTEEIIPDKAYYLIGDVNGWSDETKIPFVENDGVFTLTQTFSGQFKIKDENGNWLGGGVTLTADNPSVSLVDGGNLVLTDESEYTLTIEDGVLTVTGFPAPPALTGVELRGSYDENWTEVITYVMQNVDGAWVLNNQDIDEGFEFKVVATYDNGSQEWYGAQADGDYWVTLATLNNAIGMGTTSGYNNLFFDDAGTFTFTVNGDLTTLTITGVFDPEVFTGIVYDVLDRPIADVQVTAIPLVASVDGIMLRDEATGYTTTTPADGSFRLEVPGGVNYEVSFEKYGYLPQTLAEDEVGDIVLEWDAATAITDLTSGDNVVSVKYVSTTGVVSDAPFKGVNIMVETYQDGSRKTVKVVK